MDMKRAEILPGVWLTALRTDKFKTACMSVSLLTQLSRDTASMNAILPYVLRRGTSRYPDLQAISNRFDEMYGTVIEPVVRRIGEIQSIGFYASFPEDKYIPGNEPILAEAAGMMSEMLLSPYTRGGLLLPDYVESEKQKLIELIRSRVNEKQGYALQRCIEEMCCFEDYSVLRYGDEKSAESIHYRKLTHHYHELLSVSPVEIFYCGTDTLDSVSRILKEAFSSMPRGDINYDIGTDIRMNSVEESPRETVEELSVSQGKLVIGFRLGECMDNPDFAAIRVFNTVYGGCVSSKLFANVREKLSLCYYASSLVETHKGLMFVTSGIDCQDYDAAKNEILAQLDAIRSGNISDDELEAAKSCFASDMRSLMDSQGELEGFYLSNCLSGISMSPLELAALAEDVTKSQVIEIAKSVICDEIYFLKSDGTEDENGDQ